MASRIKTYSTIMLIIVTTILAAGCGVRKLPNPTAVTIPVKTEGIRIIASPTVSPTGLPVRTLAPQFTSTPRLITPAPSEGVFIDQSVQSPDGNWTAVPSFVILADGYQVTLRVFNSDKSLEWLPVDYKGEGVGHRFPTPKYWSADSRYFYYVEQTVTPGGGDFFPVEKNWLRLDTQTGLVDSIEIPIGRGHMFSPDETMLAYVTIQPPVTFVLEDVATGDEKSIEILAGKEATEKAQAGKILWSPAGDQIILAAANAGFADILTPTFYLLSVKVETMELGVLYEGKDYLRPLKWDKSGKIRVMDWNSKSWWITPKDGVITTSP